MRIARKFRGTIEDIPVVYEGREMTFGNLEENKKYYVLITNTDPSCKYILLGGSKRNILTSLMKLHIADREALELLDYTIRVKSGRSL